MVATAPMVRWALLHRIKAIRSASASATTTATPTLPPQHVGTSLDRHGHVVHCSNPSRMAPGILGSHPPSTPHAYTAFAPVQFHGGLVQHYAAPPSIAAAPTYDVSPPMQHTFNFVHTSGRLLHHQFRPPLRRRLTLARTSPCPRRRTLSSRPP
jgi:hypothetical protein